MIKTGLCLLGFSMLMIACNNEALNLSRYKAWVENEENGLRIKKDIAPYRFTLQYKPVEYLIAKEAKSGKVAASAIEGRKNELKELQYFNLRLESAEGKADVLMTGISKEEDYYRRANYFSYEMESKIYLVEEQDTLPCVLYHLERNYGIAPYIDIVLAFKKSEEEIEQRKALADKTLVIEEEILGCGVVRIQVDKDKINSVPTLITN